MTTTRIIDVHHLARVEGHGSIKIRIEKGEVVTADWQIVETPRYFEAMLKGKPYSMAGILTARICGICSIGHCLASIRAAERAFEVAVPEKALKLRLLAKHGETLQSHVLHLFFLAAPDFLGLTSALPLIEKNPAVIGIAARLKGLGNRLCDVIAGRTTHPVSLKVGGFAVVPDHRQLALLRSELAIALEQDIPDVVDLFQTFSIPDFVRETEYVSLKGENDYPFIGGDLISTDGVLKPEDDYLAMTNEFVDPENTSKWCRLSRESLAVGALARFNNNASFLRPGAAEAATTLGLKPVCHNPFMFNVAQLIETVHVMEESLLLIDAILSTSHEEPVCGEVEPRASEGVAAVEVPRGILYQHFQFDDEGVVQKANCIIPTTQNNLNIHHDIQALVKQFHRELDDRKLELICSQLVRAYDPCISCSVH